MIVTFINLHPILNSRLFCLLICVIASQLIIPFPFTSYCLLPVFLAVWMRKPFVSCLYFRQCGRGSLLSLVCISSSVEKEACLPVFLAVCRRKPMVSFLYFSNVEEEACCLLSVLLAVWRTKPVVSCMYF
jgi:hypothetical protein